MPAPHTLRIEVSHGSDASLYLGICSCGWISGDGRDKESIRAEHRQHVEGRKPPWIMEPGERPGWEEDGDQVQVGFRAKKKPAAPGEGDGL